MLSAALGWQMAHFHIDLLLSHTFHSCTPNLVKYIVSSLLGGRRLPGIRDQMMFNKDRLHHRIL